MCNICERLKKYGQTMPFLATGGVTEDPFGMVGIKMTKDKLSSDEVKLVVYVEEPEWSEARRVKFDLKISYCPFCGEHF